MNAAAESDFEYTDMMNTALRFINSTGRHVFLTGKAGTGKTTFLKSLSSRTHKQIAVVAPTGIAALNAGGITIHSQFLLPFGMFIPDKLYAQPPTEGANWYTEAVLARRHPLNSLRKQVLRSIDLLVIDEVSMLRADLLDAIDYRLRSVRGNFRQGFGGVQLLLIGDLYQLPPVVKREEESRLGQFYKSTWFFESKGLQRDGFTYIELNQIFRQKDDAFINVLNNLRVNNPKPEDFVLLNKYYKSSEEIQQLDEVITLTTHNHKADSMNLKALNDLASPSHFFLASIQNEFPENMYPVLQKLELKEGAQIMFTRNDNDEGAYFNGKLATVTSISGDKVTVSMAGSGISYTLRKAIWENKKYHVNDETRELEDEVAGTFEQYPVKLAWAITVHKSQGLTFEKAIIDVGEAFADGQVYVALSRLRSLDGLILRTKVDPGIVSTDKQVVSFDLNNNKPESLEAQIKPYQKEFIQRQFNRTFDFEPLLKELAYLTRSYVQSVSLQDNSMKSVLTRIFDAFSAEMGNTTKFREQLQTLMDSGRIEELLERTRKGADYYKKILWTQIKDLVQHIEDMKGEKRVKGYLNDLLDLDQVLSKKVEEVDKVFHLADVIIKGTAQFDFKTLTSDRAKERERIMAGIVKTDAGARSGEKRKKRKKNKDGPSTFDISIDMFLKGMSPELISAERELTLSTVEGHIIKGIQSGRVNVFKYISKADMDIITAALHEMSDAFTSSDLFEKLDQRFTYSQLRFVMDSTGIKSTPKKIARGVIAPEGDSDI